jgi:hypothetical protein
MARRPVPPPKPRTPNFTIGQKRRRIERLEKCVRELRAFDPHKARKRAPAVLALEVAIDKALSSAFGYGTTAYLRYNEAATLDPSPLLTDVTRRSSVQAPVGGPMRHDAKAEETRRHFSENKERSITLLRNAINTLEEEIADALPVESAPLEAMPKPVAAVARESEAGPRAPVPRPQPGRRSTALEAARQRIRRWWRRVRARVRLR